MMFRFNFGVCVLVISYLFDAALANSTRCYACNGSNCNDPFRKEGANIMYCSNNQNLPNGNTKYASSDASVGGKFKDWESLESKLLNIFFGNNNEFVCVTSLYYHNVHLTHMTIRRCMPKSYKNMAPCTYLSNIINSGYGTMQKCATCDTDLCNSGINLRHCILTILFVGAIKLLF